MPNYWYDDIKFYLTCGNTPLNLDPKKRRALRLIYVPFQLINNVLFRKNCDGIFLTFLRKRRI